MSVATLHGLYAVKVGSTVLGGITRRNLRTASEIRAQATSGDVFARFNALYAQKPMAEFGTLNIVAALAACGLTGTALTSAAPLIFYCQKQTEGGSRTSGSNHRLLTMNEGILVPRRLSCEHQGDASLDYEALITYDGSNDPIAITDSGALATHPGDTERFSLGPVVLHDGSTAYNFNNKLRVELDLGVQAETHGADSEVWDTHCRIVEIMPSIVLTGKDIEWFKSTMLPLIGRNIVHSGTAIWFRKRNKGGTYYADNTSNHLKLTIAGMAVVEQVIDASGNGVDETSVRIPLSYDGTNNPVVFTAAQAIS